MSRSGPAKRPCRSCPYRLDVPSGVWAAEEYDKLPGFDRETPLQPPTAFFCHLSNGRLCAGWCGTHDMDESLGLRIAFSHGILSVADVNAALAYVSPVALFDSGAQAAAHGKAAIDRPGPAARRIIDTKRSRRDR